VTLCDRCTENVISSQSLNGGGDRFPVFFLTVQCLVARVTYRVSSAPYEFSLKGVVL